MNAVDLRRHIGWSLVFFFLRLRGIEWEDLPLEERFAVWKYAAEQK